MTRETEQLHRTVADLTARVEALEGRAPVAATASNDPTDGELRAAWNSDPTVPGGLRAVADLVRARLASAPVLTAERLAEVLFTVAFESASLDRLSEASNVQNTEAARESAASLAANVLARLGAVTLPPGGARTVSNEALARAFVTALCDLPPDRNGDSYAADWASWGDMPEPDQRDHVFAAGAVRKLLTGEIFAGRVQPAAAVRVDPVAGPIDPDALRDHVLIRWPQIAGKQYDTPYTWRRIVERITRKVDAAPSTAWVRDPVACTWSRAAGPFRLHAGKRWSASILVEDGPGAISGVTAPGGWRVVARGPEHDDIEANKSAADAWAASTLAAMARDEGAPATLDRIRAIADEAFGPFPVQTADEALTAIERGIFGLRQRLQNVLPVDECPFDGPPSNPEPFGYVVGETFTTFRGTAAGVSQARGGAEIVTVYTRPPAAPVERAGTVDGDRLVAAILHRAWHRDCEIVPDYMPPYPGKETRPAVVVRHKSGMFLRYSKGPRQGFDWDVYGDDMLTIDLAIVALSEAPDPGGRHWSMDISVRRAPFAIVRAVLAGAKPDGAR